MASTFACQRERDDAILSDKRHDPRRQIGISAGVGKLGAIPQTWGNHVCTFETQPAALSFELIATLRGAGTTLGLPVMPRICEAVRSVSRRTWIALKWYEPIPLRAPRPLN